MTISDYVGCVCVCIGNEREGIMMNPVFSLFPSFLKNIGNNNIIIIIIKNRINIYNNYTHTHTHTPNVNWGASP